MIASYLPYYEYLNVTGEDSVRFLQGQLSCDMTKLGNNNALRGALCNLKGRVIADFLVFLHADGCVLQLRLGLGQRVLETLGKYAVFSKVELSLSSEFSRSIGIAGNESEDRLSELYPTLPGEPLGKTGIDGGYLIRLRGETPRYLLLSTDEDADFSALGIRSEDLEHWRYLEIQAGRIEVDESISEQFTPQLLNYDIAGVIDFRKGCYTGQEVVARMFYRGKPKQRLYRVESDAAVGEASELLQFRSGQEKPAQILRYANADTEDRPNLILAILATDSVSEGAGVRLSDQPEASLRVYEPAYADA